MVYMECAKCGGRSCPHATPVMSEAEAGCDYCGRIGCEWRRHGEAVREARRAAEYWSGADERDGFGGGLTAADLASIEEGGR